MLIAQGAASWGGKSRSVRFAAIIDAQHTPQPELLTVALSNPGAGYANKA